MNVGLHLGLNCVDPASYNGWPGYLVACVADARAMAGTFALAGYETSALLNNFATITALEEKLQTYARMMTRGDRLVLTYSGHGGQGESWQWTGFRETLCLYDGQWTDTALQTALSNFAPGVKIAILLDSCHSGGMDKDVPTVSSNRIKAAPLWIVEKAKVVNRAPLKDVSADVLFLTACKANELAMDGIKNGAFTSSLLETLDKTRTWGAWFQATAEHMAKEFPQQHPCLVPLGNDFRSDSLLVI